MLRLDSVRFGYAGGETHVFDLEARAGEVTAVSGASGSGKSTLLDLIAGFLTPSGGRIEIGGMNLVPLPPEQRPVSILFQSESLFEHLTAGENVTLGLPRTTPRAERGALVQAALAKVGLLDWSAKLAETLSGGERQRVALARTLLRNRPVLLLDEPFSALDDETRANVRSLVLTLTTERNWATILVTHHQEDVEAVAARRYRLSGGRLLLA